MTAPNNFNEPNHLNLFISNSPTQTRSKLAIHHPRLSKHVGTEYEEKIKKYDLPLRYPIDFLFTKPLNSYYLKNMVLVVDLVNRRPIKVSRDEYAYLDFDEEGRFKEPELEKEESSAFDMLDYFSLEQQDKRVIDARHKFARKRYFDKHRWDPTDELITAIAEAIFGKLI